MNSKAVVNGDITQIDLPKGVYSGLDQVQVLRGIPGIEMVYLTDKDVVRHELVSRIIRAYDALSTKSFERGEIRCSEERRSPESPTTAITGAFRQRQEAGPGNDNNIQGLAEKPSLAAMLGAAITSWYLGDFPISWRPSGGTRRAKCLRLTSGPPKKW